ncbi:hypothetical protein P0Y43_03555 [Pseudomonas entomophila]|uniref:hypothetical protein n=1 Tax=Pseudomonas entomophila TaxID=312306 RepID=UPI0023D8207C|nr:hypothetical protein [Pseudomonas entomophila]MDF0729806.1 hypothetical protein [Pseudomonas entomophila]
MVSPFKFDVDAVFCVSLRERQDKRDRFASEIASRISNPVAFHLMDKDANPLRATYESHRALALMALEQGWARILVFEDDAKAYALRASSIRWINRFVNRQPFEALHLGYAMGRTWLTWFPFIARGRVTATHAYILSLEGCRVFAAAPYDGGTLDALFKKCIDQHCAYPMLFRRASLTADGDGVLARHEDAQWQRNWDRHVRSPLKYLWKTLLRPGF